MTESKYEIILSWDETDQIYVATVPELPGCMAHGETRSAALKAIEGAIELWLKSAAEDGIPVPEATSVVG